MEPKLKARWTHSTSGTVNQRGVLSPLAPLTGAPLVPQRNGEWIRKPGPYHRTPQSLTEASGGLRSCSRQGFSLSLRGEFKVTCSFSSTLLFGPAMCAPLPFPHPFLHTHPEGTAKDLLSEAPRKKDAQPQTPTPILRILPDPSSPTNPAPIFSGSSSLVRPSS